MSQFPVLVFSRLTILRHETNSTFGEYYINTKSQTADDFSKGTAHPGYYKFAG